MTTTDSLTLVSLFESRKELLRSFPLARETVRLDGPEPTLARFSR